ncbi:MAG: hypothetical protein IPM33_10680 [Phycisphaerales bacterium]|nr:hypothetical protein [Phycisphaerales bacterium]
MENFKKFIEDHKDELTALQVFFGMATPDRLKSHDLNALVEQIACPPVSTTPEELRLLRGPRGGQRRGQGGRSSPISSPYPPHAPPQRATRRPSPTWSVAATMYGGTSRPRREWRSPPSRPRG